MDRVVLAAVAAAGGRLGQGGGGGGSGPVNPSVPSVNGQKQGTAAGEGSAEPIRIKMLGGKEAEDSGLFYEARGEHYTLPQLKEYLKDSKQKSPSAKMIEIVIVNKSVDSTNEAVQDLHEWAEKNGFQAPIVDDTGKREH